MIVDYLGMLETFHKKYGHYVFYGYEVPDWVVELRIKLINEEVNMELLPTLEKLKNINSVSQEEWFNRTIELADALGDSLYVIFGTCVSMGIPINEIFTEIQRSNMTKSQEKNEYGKTIKGKDFEPPRIREIFEKLLSENQNNSNESTS